MAQPAQAAVTALAAPATLASPDRGAARRRSSSRPRIPGPEPAPMLRRTVDGAALLRAVRAAVANLEAHVAEVDALNVFPVPDGDTGSNMLATMRAALEEAERLPADRRDDLPSVAAALSRGALAGARGNSGVILSQIIRGMTHGADGRRRADGLHLAKGLRRGSEVAYGAVLSPVEGTILTVIRDAADAAERAAGRRPHVEAVLTQVIAATADSVRRTPRLLPVLAAAGVVDSGGQGLYRLFEGMTQLDLSLVPRPAGSDELDVKVHVVGTPSLPRSADHHWPDRGAPDLRFHEHGYETEFLVSAADRAIDVEALRAALTAVGESVVVAGDDALARVHVHGARPDHAIAAGLVWGRLSEVSIRDLDAQVAHAIAETGTSTATTKASLIAVTAAAGLGRVLASLGARVVRPAHGTRPSVGEISAAIRATGSARVVVLPNDGDALLAARQAAEQVADVEIAIVPTRNAAEGIAAAMAFDAEATFDADAATDGPGSFAAGVARLAAEAAALRSFTVVGTARDATIDGVAIPAGTIVALDAARHLLAHGGHVADVTLAALSRLGTFELVTLYLGERLDATAASALRDRLGSQAWEAEVDLVPGGQAHDLLLVAVE